MSLADVIAPESIVEPQGRYLTDLMGRGVVGSADAVVFPSSAEEVAAVLRWCYEHDTPLTARGGGTGLAGGAIPVSGGVVIGFDRLNRVRQFDPLLWRMHVEAGVTTGDVQRLARESGLRFPPDPGAAEMSQIGGNIACNAGGPHAFKYGVTGHWVTGIEAVIPPGRDRHDRRPAAQGRRLLRPEEPADRLRRDARADHGGLAAPRPRPRARAACRRPLPRRRRRRVGDRARARLGRRPGRDRVPRRGHARLQRRLVPVRDPGGRGVHGDHRSRRLARRGALGSPASCAKHSARTRSPSTHRRIRRRSRSCGAGAAASHSRSSRSAAAPTARTSPSRSTACATSPARRSRSRSATTSPGSRSGTRATATSTRPSSSRPTTPTRSAVPTPRATSCSSSRYDSAAPSPASTGSAG